MAQLIDTSVFIALERQQLDLDVLARIFPDEPVALAAITASELLAGVHYAGTEERRKRLHASMPDSLWICGSQGRRWGPTIYRSRLRPLPEASKWLPTTCATLAACPALRSGTWTYKPESRVITPGTLWVSSYDDDAVVRVDLRTDTVAATVTKLGRPTDIAAGDGALWVIVKDSPKLIRIDPRTNRVVNSISVGTDPQSVAVGRGAVWVNNGTGKDLKMGTNGLFERRGGRRMEPPTLLSTRCRHYAKRLSG